MTMNEMKPGFEKRHEGINWRTTSVVQKWSVDQTAYATALLGHDPSGDELVLLCGQPEDGIHEDSTSNLITTAGLARITSLMSAGGGQAITATSCRLGVGDSATAALVGDTDLGAASGSGHRQFYIMDATYPTVSGGVFTFKATFASADAVFVWNEWCVDVGTPTVANGTTVAALMLNHKIAAMGTKASGTAWSLLTTATLA